MDFDDLNEFARDEQANPFHRPTARAAGHAIRDAQLQISALTDHAELLRRQRDDLAMWLAQAVSWYASSGQHAPVGKCPVCDRAEQVTTLLERMRDEHRTSQNQVSSPAATCGDFTRRGMSSGGLSRALRDDDTDPALWRNR
jgi:hypothetical protein